jgi:hypothetical protein
VLEGGEERRQVGHRSGNHATGASRA